MIKRVLSALSVLLILALCLTFAACGEKADTKTDDSASSAEKATETPTEPANGIGTECEWDGATLKVTEVTEDVSSINTGTMAPAEGKYVAVILTITDGKMDPSDLEERSKTVKLNDYTCVTAVGQGVEIDDNQYAKIIGSVDILYDVPKDFSPDDAIVTIE